MLQGHYRMPLWASVFVTVSHLYPSLKFADKAGTYVSRAACDSTLKEGSNFDQQILDKGTSDKKWQAHRLSESLKSALAHWESNASRLSFIPLSASVFVTLSHLYPSLQARLEPTHAEPLQDKT